MAMMMTLMTTMMGAPGVILYELAPHALHAKRVDFKHLRETNEDGQKSSAREHEQARERGIQIDRERTNEWKSERLMNKSHTVGSGACVREIGTQMRVDKPANANGYAQFKCEFKGSTRTSLSIVPSRGCL